METDVDIPYHRCECIFVAIVNTVSNNIPAPCDCGNDGGNYGFAQIINYFYDNYIRYGTFFICLLGSTFSLDERGTNLLPSRLLPMACHLQSVQ